MSHHLGRFVARLTLLAVVTILGFSLGACDQKKGITGVQPNFGNIAGNDDVTILGKGFKPGLEVRFAGGKAKGLVIESDTKIRLKTPSGTAGKADISVTDEAGHTVVLKDAFTYRTDVGH
ncbi:MAG: IPT/TIG domain-containing protein [Deltaproteobacteria bacterium]|nr:IPT/TIG domain-containing protein [Deltaproteobacteria bacterium]